MCGVSVVGQNECRGGPPKYRPHLTEVSHYIHVSKLLSDAHTPEMVLLQRPISGQVSVTQTYSLPTSTYVAQTEERFSITTINLLVEPGGVRSP